MTTLDALKFPKVNFIKIDVEGTELDVLEGGRDLITQLKPNMLIEMQDSFMNQSVFNFLMI